MNRFSASFFTGNRARLCQELPNSVIVITAHSALQKSADVSFPFRQDSNFWYLTGIVEPEFILMIDTVTQGSTIFLPEQNEYQIEWDGKINVPALQRQSGVDEIKPRSSFFDMLQQAAQRDRQLCSLNPLADRIEPYGFFANPARKLLYEIFAELDKKPVDIRLEIARLRQIKQQAEIDALKQAISVTGESLAVIKKNLGTFSHEKDIERALSAEFYGRGADGHAYEPIIASGPHAAVIHYNANNGDISSNSLLLLDTGALCDGYAADISRTWAIGKPTTLQQKVYESVLLLQDKAFSLLKEGVILKEFQHKIEESAFKEVKKLGLTLERYPHGISHFLGLDVHDAGDYDRPLPVNTVITVEPGLYFQEKGIGVRLEDDVLIQENGILVLSEGIPREL